MDKFTAETIPSDYPKESDMEKNFEAEHLRQELMRLTQELLVGARTEKPSAEMEKIRQRISDITFVLSSDTRKIHDLS